MNDLINAGVMQGLIGAYSSVQLASVSMGIYEQAKTQGNTDAAERALGYATSSMTDAQKFNEDAKEALQEAQESAKEAEKARQEADLERPAESDVTQTDSRPTPAPQNQNLEIHLKHAVDRAEISEQGKEAAAGEFIPQPAELPAETKASLDPNIPQPQPSAHTPRSVESGKITSKIKPKFSAKI